MKFRKIDEFVFDDKKVLLRADFNVPVDDKGNVLNDKKIRATIPTIKKLLDKNARQIIIMSHLGRPKGQVVEKWKMNSVAKRLSELLGQEVVKLDNCIDVVIPKDKKLVMLENLRFHAEEKSNDMAFARKLAGLGHVYVNDAFGVSHRADASLDAIAQRLPGCAGLLMQKEIETLGNAMESPQRPFVAIIGGLKVSDKILLIEHLLPKVDTLIIGGAMMFTFWKAKGYEISNSIVEQDKIEFAKGLLKNPKIVLPVDTLAGKEMKPGTEKKEFDDNKMEPGWIGLDVGRKSVDLFKTRLQHASTILWNGPLGWFEDPQFESGTKELAKALAASTALTIVGGGESATAIEKYGLQDKITHVSTGGGACIEFIEGKELPGIKALEKNISLFPQE